MFVYTSFSINLYSKENALQKLTKSVNEQNDCLLAVVYYMLFTDFIVYWLLFTWSVRRERGSRRPQVAPLLQPSEKHNKTHEIFENNLNCTFYIKTNELCVSEVFI